MVAFVHTDNWLSNGVPDALTPADIVQLLSALKSYVVPFIVSVRVVGTFPERAVSSPVIAEVG